MILKHITLVSLLLIGELAMATHLEKAKEFFDTLSVNNLAAVDKFYDQDTFFQDPIHQLKGAKAVKDYYAGLYKNVDSIRFEFLQTSEVGNLVTLEWRMHLKTPYLNGGEPFSVDGVSLITFGGKEDKAITHRDYFDMGEFVYERVPVLSSVIKYAKKRMKGSSAN